MLSSNREIKCKDIHGVMTSRSTDDIARECGFTWQEGVTAAFSMPSFAYAPYLPELKENAEKLVLTKLSDEVGYGVLTNEKAQPIKANQLVTIYAGKIEHHTKDAYLLNKVSAYKHGNMGRFFPHLPTKLQLIQYEFSHTLSSFDVATVNMKVISLNKFISAFVTTEQVEAGKVIGISYGENYWSAHSIKPKLFTKSGSIIDESLYKVTPGKRKFYDCLLMTPMLLAEEAKLKDVVSQLTSCESADELNEKIGKIITAECVNSDAKNLMKWMSLYIIHTMAIFDQRLMEQFNFDEKNIPENVDKCKNEYILQINPEFNLDMLKSAIITFDAMIDDETLALIKPALKQAKASLVKLSVICEEKLQITHSETIAFK